MSRILFFCLVVVVISLSYLYYNHANQYIYGLSCSSNEAKTLINQVYEKQLFYFKSESEGIFVKADLVADTIITIASTRNTVDCVADIRFTNQAKDNKQVIISDMQYSMRLSDNKNVIEVVLNRELSSDEKYSLSTLYYFDHEHDNYNRNDETSDSKYNSSQSVVAQGSAQQADTSITALDNGHSEYIATIVNLVRPEVIPEDIDQETTLVVKIKLKEDMSLKSIEVKKYSSSEEYNQAIIKKLKSMQKFPALPARAKFNEYKTMVFTFSPKQSW